MTNVRTTVLARGTLALTMVVTFAVASGSSEVADTQAESLVLPGHVGEFRLRGTKGFEDPRMGTLFAYEDENAGSLIDVYVYPATPLGSQEHALTERDAISIEVKTFMESLPVGQARGWYDAYRIAYENRTEVDVNGRAASGHTVGVVFRRGRKAQVSLYYIFLLRGQFVKVRSTMPAAGFSDTTVPRFVDLLIRQLATS